MKSINAAVGIMLLLAVQASAQWAKHPDNTIPRGHDGKPNLSAETPTAPDGKPDLSGIWLPDPDPNGTPLGVENLIFPRYFVDITADLKPEQVPFQPAAAALFKKR